MVTKSIPCKSCQNDLWDIEEWTTNFDTKIDGYKLAVCTNCRYERLFVPHKNRDDYITPSQQKAADRIKDYFQERWNNGKELAKFTVTLQDETGYVYVNIETTDNTYTRQGGYFVIGRRGGIRLLHILDLCSDEKEKEKMMKHYAKMIGAKKGW